MTRLIRLLFVPLCLLLAAAPAGAGTTWRAAQEKTPSLSELRREANQAAARFSRARADFERLADEITRLEQRAEELRERMAPLRQAVTRRVVALYKGSRGLDVVADLGGLRDPVATAREVRLVAQASATDIAALEELTATAGVLRQEQAALEVRRREQQVALDKLEGERRDVELKLAMMVRAGRELQSRLVGTPSRPGPARASRSDDPAAVPGGPVSVPVATDFICPIRGPVAFTDSWGDPRSGGRRHKGTDMMSPHGTDNVAVVSGHMKRHHSGAGGLSIYLYGDDGNTYYYAHLSEVVGPDRLVPQGEVIGKTGNSGNARGGSPHTHFEIHPGGGAAVNPYPVLAAHC